MAIETSPPTSHAGRPRRKRALAALALAPLLLPTPGCGDAASITAFRDAAAPAVTEGLTTLFRGFIEGAFASRDVNANTGTSGDNP